MDRESRFHREGQNGRISGPRPYDENSEMQKARRYLSGHPRIIFIEKDIHHCQSESDPTLFYVVRVEAKTCTCPRFRETGKPCKHILALKVVI